VLDFGACGEGTDDGPAIRWAIGAAAAGGGTLLFPLGTYSDVESLAAPRQNYSTLDCTFMNCIAEACEHTGAHLEQPQNSEPARGDIVDRVFLKQPGAPRVPRRAQLVRCALGTWGAQPLSLRRALTQSHRRAVLGCGHCG
jgi:hypothetical protein